MSAIATGCWIDIWRRQITGAGPVRITTKAIAAEMRKNTTRMTVVTTGIQGVIAL